MEKEVIKKVFDEIKMLQINCIMICIIDKISVLLKTIRILKTLFKESNRLLFSKKIIDFEKEGIIKDVKNLFRF